jgi:hypothetical protein
MNPTGLKDETDVFDSGGHLGSCAADVRTLDKIRIGMGAQG